MKRIITALLTTALLLIGGAALAEPATAAPTSTTNQACDDHDWNNCIDPSCESPGNPAGICWYAGYQFPNRTICIEAWSTTSWNNATAESTLNWVQYQWAVNGVRIYVRTTQGACATAGFTTRQIVQYIPYVADDGHCGLAYSMGAGYTTNTITINMHANVTNGFQYTTLCRSGSTWNKTWGHEMGHELGLTHYAEQESLMSFGTYRSSIDAWKMENLYTGNPCGDPLWPACV
jgi:hypothetical protein